MVECARIADEVWSQVVKQSGRYIIIVYQLQTNYLSVWVLFCCLEVDTKADGKDQTKKKKKKNTLTT